jgi:hypothetical protein
VEGVRRISRTLLLAVALVVAMGVAVVVWWPASEGASLVTVQRDDQAVDFLVSPYGGPSFYVPDGEGLREIEIGGQVWLARPTEDGYIGIRIADPTDHRTTSIFHVDDDGNALLDGQAFRNNVAHYFAHDVPGVELDVIHHDVMEVEGGYLFLVMTVEPDGSVVDGELPRSDWIIESDHDGSVRWAWNVAEGLLGDQPVDLGERGEHWIHTNSLDLTAEGDVVISARNLAEVVVVSRPEGGVLARFGEDVLSEQHHATVQPNGDILVFDNGFTDKHSSVVRFGPDGSLKWQRPLFDAGGGVVYGGAYGSAQITSRGTVLVCAGPDGQVFEYDAELVTVLGEWRIEQTHPVPWAPGGAQSACYRVYETLGVGH